MFDILVYLFENYFTPQACPDADVLARKLVAAGFEHEDIDEALSWLYGLAQTTEHCSQFSTPPGKNSFRIYTDDENRILGAEAISFIGFLENSGVLPPATREIVIDRALETDESPVPLDKMRVIALMVLWSQEADIDHLVLEELLSIDAMRQAH